MLFSSSRNNSRNNSSNHSRSGERKENKSINSINSSSTSYNNSPCNLSVEPNETDSFQSQPNFFRSTAYIPSLFPLHRLTLPQARSSNEELSPSVSAIVIPPVLCCIEMSLQNGDIDISNENSGGNLSSKEEQLSSLPVSSTPEITGNMLPRMIKFATPNINGVRTPCSSPSKSVTTELGTPKNKVSSLTVTLSPDGHVSDIRRINFPSY